MKKLTNFAGIFIFAALLLVANGAQAQEESKADKKAAKKAQRDEYWKNFRAYDKSGINVFEPVKETPAAFDKVRVRVGAGFTQQFQSLEHSNGGQTGNNFLYPMTSGFNTASANLYLDAMLYEGIRLNLTTYLSSRHHNETWVKGGFIQIDKIPFKGKFFEDLSKIATIKAGHFELNYGDAHHRRTDGGHALYNPFMESYIIDGFDTQIGAEIYLQKNGFMGMMGVSNGQIKGNIDANAKDANGKEIKKTPAVFFKGAFDKQIDEKLRVRAAASYYYSASSPRNTLFWGDRTGSNYYMVMEPEKVAGAKNTAASAAWSGRVNPNMTRKLAAMQLNGFIKYAGLEIFGTVESLKGRSAAETTDRKLNQYAIDGVYRIGKKENLFIGARYNTMNGDLSATVKDVTVNRVALAGGWFLTDNILLKAEIINQEYKGFSTADIRSNGKFNGYVVQAIVGF